MSEIFNRLRDVALPESHLDSELRPLGEVRLSYNVTGQAVITIGLGQSVDFGEAYGCDISLISSLDRPDIYANAPQIVLARYNIDPGKPVDEEQMQVLVDYVLERIEIAQSFLSSRADVLTRHVNHKKNIWKVA